MVQVPKKMESPLIDGCSRVVWWMYFLRQSYDCHKKPLNANRRAK